MVRCAYFEHPDYVPLLTRALTKWRELERVTGRTIFHNTGVLLAGTASSEVVLESIDSARTHGLEHETLTAQELRARFPMFALPDSFLSMFEPHTGFVRPEWAVEAALADAQAHGATVLNETRVLSISPSATGVTVATTRGDFQAERIIVTAGPWSQSLAPWPSAPLRVTRQVIVWIAPDDPTACAVRHLPTFCIDASEGFLYGCPIAPDQPGPPGLKVAWHVLGDEVNPDLPIAPPTADECSSIERAIAHYLPGCRGPVGASATCLYSNSPDSNFLIGSWGDSGRVFAASGFSGHGFKFMPVMGEALADLATTGATTLPIGFLSPARLAHSAAGDVTQGTQ